jgi:NADH dehydrogenase [ubiquinone] 1 alpha subcomplex assembly factor 7
VSTDPSEAIRQRIRTDGPITFATYMELALYGPGGYYEEPPVGADGDFVTSPHVHPAFGLFVARALKTLADDLGSPEPLRVTEVGAGDGTLASQIVRELDAAYTAVEISAGARRALAKIDGLAVRERLAAPVDLVLAHELLDNLPFRSIRGGHELVIDLDGDALIEMPAPIDDELAAVLHGIDTTDDLVAPIGALAFVDELAGVLTRGYALLIDYGDEAGAGGEPHGYRGHRIVGDVLSAPGTTDITSGVDFGWVARHAKRRGLQAFPSVLQRDALLALGFEPWYREELARQQELLTSGQSLEAVRTWSARSRAMMLVDPGALGRMRWLLLATPGLPEPDWLREARPKTD